MSLTSLCSIHTVTHYRLTRARGDYGGGTVTRTQQTSTTKRCRIQPRTGTEDDAFESPDERITHMLYFSTDPSAQARDQFDYVDGSVTLTLEVENVIEFDQLNRLWRVDCIELKKKTR